MYSLVIAGCCRLEILGSIQLAEFRASPRAGLDNHQSTSTRSTRYGLRRGVLHRSQFDTCEVQRNRLSVHMSSTLATSSLRCHAQQPSPVVAIHQPSSLTVVTALVTQPVIDSQLNEETDNNELDLSTGSRINRSGANHRRRKDLID